MKFWTHPDYHNGKLRKLLCTMDDVPLEIKYGNFKIKYTGYDNSSYFGIFSWKQCSSKFSHVEFYENDELLFTKEINRPREFHFIINGDGITKENTFYIWFGKNEKNEQCVKINDFNDKHIKDTSLGPDCYTGLIQVSDNYFVVLTEELCTFSRFFGLVNIKEFFIEENIKCWNGSAFIPISHVNLNSNDVVNVLNEIDEQVSQQLEKLGRPYNNARIGLCVDWHDQCSECMEPIESNEEGLFFADVKFTDDFKNKIFTTIDFVKYDDVKTYDQ